MIEVVHEFLSQLFQRGDPAAVAAAASLVVSVIALLGTILSALVLFLNARSSLYASTVTSERSKWINALRENIASVSGKLRTLSFRIDRISQADRDATVSEVNNLISLIHLQLNPFGKIERNVAIILNRMPGFAEQQDGQRLRREDDLLIAHCQWLLKAEWEKVKYEVSSLIVQPWLWFKRQDYLYRYDRFSTGEGALGH